MLCTSIKYCYSRHLLIVTIATIWIIKPEFISSLKKDLDACIVTNILNEKNQLVENTHYQKFNVTIETRNYQILNLKISTKYVKLCLVVCAVHTITTFQLLIQHSIPFFYLFNVGTCVPLASHQRRWTAGVSACTILLWKLF